MKVIRKFDSNSAILPKSALTIGNFDGVHCGHQRIIAEAKRLGFQADLPVVVLTFDPHPLTVVRPEQAPAMLMPLEERLKALEANGVDTVIVAHACEELLSLTPEAFIHRVVRCLNPQLVVEGATFGFGHGRKGTTEMLGQFGAQYGFKVLIVEPVTVELSNGWAMEVSSSRIREMISAGRVSDGQMMLGRHYALLGDIISGHHRGAGLGFPTANVRVDIQLVPADGVYAGIAWTGTMDPKRDKPWTAAISIGSAPTFADQPGSGSRQVEAHLLNADEDLYGKTIRLEFGLWLRGQVKFGSIQELKVQIGLDVEACRRFASSATTRP